MIANEYQYRLTQAAAKKFRQALNKPVVPTRKSSHPQLLEAEHDALQSQLATLESEIADYALLKKDHGDRIETGSRLQD